MLNLDEVWVQFTLKILYFVKSNHSLWSLLEVLIQWFHTRDIEVSLHMMFSTIVLWKCIVHYCVHWNFTQTFVIDKFVWIISRRIYVWFYMLYRLSLGYDVLYYILNFGSVLMNFGFGLCWFVDWRNIIGLTCREQTHISIHMHYNQQLLLNFFCKVQWQTFLDTK